MVEVGQLWERGAVSIADEHAATEIAGRAAGLAAEFSGSPSLTAEHQVALLATVDGEHHGLGLRMVADTLQALGFATRYLGNSVPLAELCTVAVEMQADVIGLSLAMPDLAASLEDELDILRVVSPRSRFLIGGQGVTPALAERTGADFVENVEQLEAMFKAERVLAGAP